jgi:hypothetical protein
MSQNFERDDAEWVSSHSWRTKFYGLIQEGHKERVSPIAIKVIVGCLAIVVATLQIFSGVSSESSKNALPSFEGAKLHFEVSDSNLNIPAFDPQKQREQEIERERKLQRQRQIPPIVGRLQTIRLSTLKGVPTGTEVQAVLSSGGTNGTVVAKLKESVMVDGEVILPAKTILFGRGFSSEERLFIRFKKAILPDKTEQVIQAQVFDNNDRMVGLKGKKVSDTAFKLAASSGLIFLSGLADGFKTNDSVNIFGPHSKPNVHDAALNGVATATSEQGMQMLESMKTGQARIEVGAETLVIVIFGNDVND